MDGFSKDFFDGNYDEEKFIDPLNYPFDIEKVMNELKSEISDRIQFKFHYLPQLLEKEHYDLTKDEEIQRLKRYLIKKNILEIENHRFRQQAALFTERQIQNWIIKNFNKVNPYFKELKLIGEEQKIRKGRIDLLAKNTKEHSVIGIEIKRSATKQNVNQFYRYIEGLKKEYGENSKLIVLSNRFTESLLDMDMSVVELWRYELKWGYRKNKIKDNVYFIKNLKARPFYEGDRLAKLINWRV
ncbi:hypothetical protein EMIT0210MI2_12317 [Priestia megaterium]|uniref:endonuclease NucS domain-containing protein n=1 Tax=Priestia megaterium TaxID=1404 RepID=UPI0039E0718A